MSESSFSSPCEPSQSFFLTVRANGSMSDTMEFTVLISSSSLCPSYHIATKMQGMIVRHLTQMARFQMGTFQSRIPAMTI